jgi:hypothetical protein
MAGWRHDDQKADAAGGAMPMVEKPMARKSQLLPLMAKARWLLVEWLNLR